MAAPWIFLLIAVVLFMGPFRRRSWRRARWDNDTMNASWNQDRGPLTADREKRDRQREEQIETLETRVTELESRLDYAERLMTQRRESQAVGALPPAQ